MSVSRHPASVPGVRLGAAAAGIRYRDRDDLVLMELAPGTECAGAFTRNAFGAAPVQVARAHLEHHHPRLLVINSGNANAGTGARGLADAEATCAAGAEQIGCRHEEVLPFSTGVIGEHLPMDRVLHGVAEAGKNLSADGWSRAAEAILTTDTRPKLASLTLEAGGRPVIITAMAKGAGMICPNMATLLAFIATDARISKADLAHCLETSLAHSLNAITVDGDTSTNDACVVAATGAAGGPPLGEDRAALEVFRQGLGKVCEFLAVNLIRDAEGATKLVAVEVEHGRDAEECRRVAYTVAHSPLVKTALYASDANWGRILAAVGRSGLEDMDVGAVSITLGRVCIVRNGEVDPSYRDELGQEAMAAAEITVRISLGRGEASARVWTSDLSHEYVKINAEYRS